MSEGERILKVAMAGAGMAAGLHLSAWSKINGAQIVAISDPDERRAQARAAEFGIEKIFGDTTEMLDAVDADAIDIVTPVETHGALLLDAASRSLPAMCQKPLAGSIAEAEEIVRCLPANARVMIHENWRFRTWVRQIKEWMDQDRIGKTVLARVDVVSGGLVPDREGEIPPSLQRQPFLARMPKFLVLEVLVHHFDTLSYLFGPIEILAANLTRASPLVLGEDTGALLISASDGTASVSLIGCLAAIGEPSRAGDRVLIYGTHGRIELAGNELSLIDRNGRNEALRVLNSDSHQDGYDNSVAHFARALRDDMPFEVGPERHLSALRLVEDAYRLAGK